MKIENGTIINQYKIVSAIGAGGMGEVYLAEDTKLERLVAIKFLNQEYAQDADKLNRFIQEAKAASALNHPNILTVYEIGESGGTNYIATEFIEGNTLRQHLSSDESISLSTILKIGVQVSEALSTAHQAGIIHRDIKPENIMIRDDGYAKVLDFGLAKLLQRKGEREKRRRGEDESTLSLSPHPPDSPSPPLTNPGMVMGTVSYMSPEQARGKEVDARTDIWSLGVVLYEMLSGKVPFSGETINHTIVSILEKEPKLLDNVPDELQRIVRKTLVKEVEMRYQTARDLLIDLKNLRRTLDIQGELERSIIPNREVTKNQVQENETLAYSPKSIEETKAESGAKQTQKVTTSSSLEYAVTQARSHKLATALIGIILLSIISVIIYFTLIAKSSTKQIESIAVMPFVNESGNADVEYLSDGMTETLINSLSQIPNLAVKARSSVFRYKGKEIDLKKIASELNVQAILTGRVVQRGEQLILNLELIDAQTENIRWGNKYERKASELVSLQSEIGRDVSGKLKARLSGAEEAKVTKTSTTNPEAYQLYLKGRFYWNKRTIESLKQAAELFKQATEKDPNYALAYSGLAETYVIFSSYSIASPKESMPQAKAMALRALEIDNSLAEPHAVLGLYLENFEWDQVGAEREIRRAVELNPNNATAHQWLGTILLNYKRFDESLASYYRAEALDPLSPVISVNIADSLLRARRYDEAFAQLNRILALYPDFAYAHIILAEGFYKKGMNRESIAEYRRTFELDKDPVTIGGLGLVLAKSGQRDEALRLLNELKAESVKNYVPGYAMALIHIGLNQKEEALTLLEKEVTDRTPAARSYAMADELDDLRSEPRFKAMLKQMNLPE